MQSPLNCALLILSLLSSGCAVLDDQPSVIESSDQATDTLPTYLADIAILAKNPRQEALAANMARKRADQLFSLTDSAAELWRQPLDLARPDPYAHYPDDLYQKLRRNLSFDLTVEEKRVMQQLRWYASHQGYLDRVSKRASRYLYHIVAELERRGLPLDLALLPIVESAFDPFAYSHGRASGMWQFIPSTGRMYGLKQNWWYDGRRDVVESTRAALDYLEQLNKMFAGDWLLALASYNSGPGTVLKAQRRNRAAGKPTDFWHLRLPKETEAYVPKMFALAKLIHAPDDFGVKLLPISAEPFFAEVSTGGQIDLAQAANLAEMSLNDLYLLNPGFNRWATDPDGPHKLLVFADKADIFKANIAHLPANARLNWHRYHIKSGDSLLTIAKAFNVTVEVIKDVNNIRGSLIRANDTLLIPVASKDATSYPLSANNRLKRKQNALAGTNKTRIEHRVKPGDTLWDLAKFYRVSASSIARWNNMAPKDVLQPNQVLVIWSDGVVKQASIDSPKIVRKVNYIVRSGDSLHRIADRFNIRVSSIGKWNRLPNKYLQPGDRLVLYVDVTQIN